MKRSEQLIKNTWNLEMMYNKDNLNEDLEVCHEIVKELTMYQEMDFSKKTIIDALSLYFKLLIKIENIYVYFSHSQDVDYGNSEIVGLFNMVKGEYNKMMVATSFLMPKISKVNNDILQSILDDEAYLDYHKTIEDIINNKKYYLSESNERIISIYSATSNAAGNVFSSFTSSDLKFADIKNKDDESKALTEGTYANYIRSNDRILRKNAFEGLLNTYGKYNHFLATNYLNDLKRSYVSMQVRGFKSTLQQALEPNQIPLEVYYNLLDSVEKNIHINHEYIKLRKERLGVENLHLYDTYVSLIDDVDKPYPYEQAQQLVKEAFKVFNQEYQDVVTEALNNRWIDVYENEGKRTGAYSGGSYTSVPYILLNYTNELNDVFTLAHELGHSMHSYFANKHNPYQNANYKIFIAEVASTVNELILINYLLEKETDPTIISYLENYLLDQFRTTLIRQTMFSRFELTTHQMVENNDAISNEILNDLYLDINKQYFGNDIIIDDSIKYEWSRIPHFYYNYYVYQYATCFSCALNIVERIKNKEANILEKYLEFLKVGDSVYPMQALKIVDIDLTSPLIFDQAMEQYHETIKRFSTK